MTKFTNRDKKTEIQTTGSHKQSCKKKNHKTTDKNQTNMLTTDSTKKFITIHLRPAPFQD